jgi:hypothetical protein
MVQKFWAKLLGIGPALRLIASMSRSLFPSWNRSTAIPFFFYR